MEKANKNYGKVYYTVWGVLFVLFNAITLISTANTIGLKNAGGSFFIAYGVILISFGVQLLCSAKAFSGNKDELFIRSSVITRSMTCLILTAVLCTVLMALSPVIPAWITVCISIVILAYFVIATCLTGFAADHAIAVDKEVKTKTSFIKNLTVDAESLCASLNDTQAKAMAKTVAEALRYSDPMSCPELSSIEGEIEQAFNEFKTQPTAENCKRVTDLIDSRSRKCKLLK